MDEYKPLDLGVDFKFDLIVDDGSHVPWHQIFTLEYLFHHLLKDGGKASQLVPVIFLFLFSSFDPP